MGEEPLCTHIPSHKQLDPACKRDVDQALALYGKTLKDLLNDVAAELKAVPQVTLDFVPLDKSIVESLIKDYISPAWFAYAGDQEGQTHFHNLANNLRLNAGLPVNGVVSPLAKLHKSNAQGIIYRWLSPAWFKAKEAGKNDVAKQLNATAMH
ncbi:hypothetical protein J2Z32_002508 [Paenibacillus turicensis]|uniref:Uncharacterized protein n=1 Tax=Paenibacillus turicensis TaxID=160487 RepID=A0ABS4FTJ1_9BACL|nr:hypothetical protein [Paenibacillus turicensis]MBP1905860.1 hypothetical protein [Paenibacillus turicensis]